MEDKYCVLENDGVSLCVCKHKPCKQIRDLKQEIESFELSEQDANDIIAGLRQSLMDIKKIAEKFDYWSNGLADASNVLWEIKDKIDEVLK